MKTWVEFRSSEVTEAVLPMNKGFGFVGTAGAKSHEMLDQAVKHVKKAAADHPHFKLTDQSISHFLDSAGGRHLADMMNYNTHPDQIHQSLSRNMKEFSKTYDPNMFESYADTGEDLVESDPHMMDVYAKAFSTAGKAAAAKRKERDAKARAEYLAKKNGTTAAPEEPKQTEVIKKHGIMHANKAKASEHWKALRKILDKPLPAKTASGKLKDHTDDSRLHSDLDHFAKTNPDIDTRPLVKKHLERIRKTG